jgi:hypothetical protein
MTYFYKIGGTIARKVGGNPPTNEYVAIDPKGIVRHVKNEMIIEEQYIDVLKDSTKDQEELYKDIMGSQIAKNMLFPKYRKKKIMKPKSIRKIKMDKGCKCK